MKFPRPRLAATLFAGLIALVPTGAMAGCVAQTMPTTELPVTASGFCVSGSIGSHDEPQTKITLASSGRYRVSLDTLPGQTGLTLLAREDAAGSKQVWQGATARGNIVSPVLFLSAGNYSITVSTSGTPIVYRLQLEPGPAMPPILDLPVAESFDALQHGSEEKHVVAWTVSEASADVLWTISAQGDVGLSMSLGLLNATGSTVATTDSPDAAGVFRLADLRLPVGKYQIVTSGAPVDAALLLGAVHEARPPDFAAEPNDQPEMATPLIPSRAATGRLVSNGTYGEHDDFALTVSADAAVPGYDVVLAAPSSASLSLALLDDDGSIVVQRDGARRVVLHALRLAPGRHVFQVSGALPAELTYSLQVSAIGPPAPGQEREPNDVAAGATALPPSGAITGDFSGDDRDFLDLTVTSGLQLWEIEAVGDGVSGLNLYDGAGQVIAATSRSAATGPLGFSHLLLPPGHNVLRLSGSGGDWLLKAVPIGAPIEGEEFEPDDRPTDAIALVVDRPQLGWLEQADDRDVYTFHVGARQHVDLSLDAPPELAVQLRLSWSDARDRIAEPATTAAPGKPQHLEWDGMLEPGDYFIELASIGGISKLPYTLRLELPSNFIRPLDLEPNDAPWQAVSLPAALQLDGVLQGDSDTDWFALDPTLQNTSITARAEVMGSSLSLQLTDTASSTLQRADLYAVGETATLTLPMGRTLLKVTGSAGAYSIRMGDPAPAVVAPAEAKLSFDLTPVAAFEPVAQTLEGTLLVKNTGSQALTFGIASWIGEEQWSLVGLPGTIEIAAGGSRSIPLELEVAADARADFPIYAEVALTDPNGRLIAFARSLIAVSTGVLPVGPHPFAPLPSALLGGLNVAAAGFGATTDPSQQGLIDGVVNVDGVSLSLSDQPVIQLAGDREMPVAGVVLQPPPGGSASQRLGAFAVEVSRDGASFERVLTAALSPIAREQGFILPSGTLARAVRLVPLSAQGGPALDHVTLAEFEVIAAHDLEFDPAGFDIASRALGGHVVQASGFGDVELTGEAAAWPGDRPVLSTPDRLAPPEWTMAFLNGRSAHLASMSWKERADTPPDARITAVDVLASNEGPLGPWTTVGRWQVDTSPDFAFQPAAWTRALKFSVADPPSGAVSLPLEIEVHESAGPSILGSWGDLSPAGPYEAQLPPGPVPTLTAPVYSDATSPSMLAIGETAAGMVRRGVDEAWYKVELPADTRLLRATFDRALTPNVAVSLVGTDGTETPLEPDPERPGTLSAVAGAGSWRVRVVQPRASVAVSWDTSDSVSSVYPAVSRMIRQLAWQLDPRREAINLVPFRGEATSFLMADWSSDRADVFAALHAYPLKDSSSDAEDALLFAATRLGDRVGTRAVVLITDASYSGVHANQQLWESLERAKVGIFALHLPADADPARVRAQLNLMSDWARAGDGSLSRLASQGDSQAAFQRLQAWLDRPAPFSFTLAADSTPPKPGKLDVQIGGATADPTSGGPATPPIAVEVILDASGSMLQHLGARSKIEIAKEALIKLARTELPDGLPVALRVFGHDRAGSCANQQLVSLSPLDRDAFVRAVEGVQSVNLARTSIANTIREAGRDLTGGAAAGLVVLVTDGNETCGGDPLAEIDTLRRNGVNVRLNVVGFAIEDAATQALLRSWASAGHGGYFDASTGDALTEATSAAVTISYAVHDAAGAEVARGVVGGEPVELPAGQYTVRVGDDGTEQTVQLRSGLTTTLSL